MSSIESQHPASASATHGTGGYLELIADDDYVDRYVGPSATATDDSGYLVPSDERPAPFYIVQLPSPPPPHEDDETQEATTTDANPDAPKSLDANSGYLMPSEGDADGGHYRSVSEGNSSPDAYTKLQLRDSSEESSNTDSVRVSQVPDDVKHQYEQSEIAFQ